MLSYGLPVATSFILMSAPVFTFAGEDNALFSPLHAWVMGIITACVGFGEYEFGKSFALP